MNIPAHIKVTPAARLLSLSMRLLKGSGSGQSKQRVDGKDWLITLCNWWSNKAVRVIKTELTKTNKLN